MITYPEAPVHPGVQGAQAAQGDPERKSKKTASVPRGSREWVQAAIPHASPEFWAWILHD